MDNVRQVIEHPELQKMRVQYEIEIADLKEQVAEKESDLDEANDKIYYAENYRDNLYSALEELITNEKGEVVTVDIEKARQTLTQYNLRLGNREKEWSTVGMMVKVLENIQPEVIHRTETHRVKVEVLPESIKINGISYKRN